MAMRNKGLRYSLMLLKMPTVSGYYSFSLLLVMIISNTWTVISDRKWRAITNGTGIEETVLLEDNVDIGKYQESVVVCLPLNIHRVHE